MIGFLPPVARRFLNELLEIPEIEHRQSMAEDTLRRTIEVSPQETQHDTVYVKFNGLLHKWEYTLQQELASKHRLDFAPMLAREISFFRV
jgi:hypothetical protein